MQYEETQADGFFKFLFYKPFVLILLFRPTENEESPGLGLVSTREVISTICAQSNGTLDEEPHYQLCRQKQQADEKHDVCSKQVLSVRSHNKTSVCEKKV